MTTTLAKLDEATLPAQLERRGVPDYVWRTVTRSVYPGAKAESVLTVLDYCKALNLDPLKRCVHIVPMEVKLPDGSKEWRDVIIPGIAQHRLAALRSGEYLGHSTPQYGPDITFKSVATKEWCAMTFYRWHTATQQRLEFPITTWFREVVKTNPDGKPNARWAQAPIQMLTKNCESAGLREAFPDHLGGEHTEEELAGARLEPARQAEPERPALEKPEHFDEWLAGMVAVAEEGVEAFDATWYDSHKPHRAYLMATQPERYEQLKDIAATKGTAE